jgi:hypothetical protein
MCLHVSSGASFLLRRGTRYRLCRSSPIVIGVANGFRGWLLTTSGNARPGELA